MSGPVRNRDETRVETGPDEKGMECDRLRKSEMERTV